MKKLNGAGRKGVFHIDIMQLNIKIINLKLVALPMTLTLRADR